MEDEKLSKQKLYNQYCKELDIQISDLYSERYDLTQKLNEIAANIKQLKIQKIKICGELTQHDMITDREDGMYGETFRRCSLCNYES
jgi:hypothetical protein